MRDELDIKIIDHQKNCVNCGRNMRMHGSWYCGDCGRFFGKTASEREGL